MEKEVKKLRNTLLFLFERDGLNARQVKHTKSDEVAVDDIISNDHFKNFNLDHFNAAVARNEHDKKLKEEAHFLLVEDSDGRLTVKYFLDGIKYQESEIKENVEIQENLTMDQNSIKNDENEDDDVEDTKEDELITVGQNKKKKKKSKGKNKSVSEASDEKNSAVKVLGESSSTADKDVATPVEQSKPVQAKGKKAKEVQKQCEGTDKDISGECSKEPEQERSSLKPPGDEEQNEAMNCSPQSVSPLSANGICASPSGTPSKKKRKQSGAADSQPQPKENQSKQKKGTGKQTETNETKTAAQELKQKEEVKPSENEPTKKDEKRDQNAKKADTPSKANEPTKKSPEKKQTKETNELKTKDAVIGTEADSSDDEKSPESHAESEAKKRKKKAAEDPLKQIPRRFQFLFTRKGLEEKKIAVAEDGFVKVKSIVAAYADWTEEQISEVLGDNPLYILKKDDAQDLVIKLKVEEKPSSSQGSLGMEEHVENDEWKETGKKESFGNRRSEGGAFEDGRARNSPRDAGPSRPVRGGGGGGYLPPDKICSTLFWVFREGASKNGIPFHQGNSLYVRDILNSFPNFSNTSENDVVVAVTGDRTRTFVLDDSTGQLLIRKSELRPDRERNTDSSRKSDFHLSKTMSFLLRHGAEKLRLPMLPGGFIYVADLLRYNDLKGYSESDVQRVVAENDKKRFFLAKDPETGQLKVRANQGHTFEVADLELEEITNADDFPNVIHGTYTQSWNAIKSQGLKRMGRNHIHFAPGEPGADGVISGMRGSCDVLIYVDLQKALNDGIKFYRSANNVILSPGDENGALLPKYFANAVQRHPRMKLPL